MLNVLDRYVLRQVATPLLASLSIGLLMLLAERLVRVLDTTLGKRSSLLSAFELIAYLVPHYLGTAIPAALFLGLLFAFGKLSRHNELDAMLAAGIGLHRMVRPVMMLAVLFCLFSLGVWGWLQPYTRHAYRAALFDISRVDAYLLAEEGAFMKVGTRTVLVEKLDRENNRFERVFLFDDRGEKGSETLTASRGMLIQVEGEVRPVLRLENGHRIDLKERPRENTQALAASFDATDTPLGSLTRETFRLRGEDERELTLPELIRMQETPPPGATTTAMQAELHKRLVNIVAMMMLPILAVPFAVGRTRSPKAYKFAVAMVMLVAFNELIGRGANITEDSGVTPYLTLWLPTGLLTAFALWRFYRAAFILADDGFDRLLQPLQEAVQRLLRRFRRRKVA